MAQDFRYQPREQRIPPPACLTMHFPWEGGSAQCTPDTHEEWLKAVTDWRTEHSIRAGYNGDRYAMRRSQRCTVDDGDLIGLGKFKQISLSRFDY